MESDGIRLAGKDEVWPAPEPEPGKPVAAPGSLDGEAVAPCAPKLALAIRDGVPFWCGDAVCGATEKVERLVPGLDS